MRGPGARVAALTMALLAAALASPGAAAAQEERAAAAPGDAGDRVRKDATHAAVRAAAARATGLRLVVSLDERLLRAILDDDTLLTAPIAVASDSVLEYQGRRWRFSTPRGVHRVLRKDSLPVWVPPEWHYYEAARPRGLAVRALSRDRPVALADGGRLEVRGDAVGIVRDSAFVPLPADEEIIADGVLYVPPLGTRNRRIAGELGRYRLDLGGGYMLHGTPHEESIGQAATHGCIRLREADVAWLFVVVPVGTRVYVY